MSALARTLAAGAFTAVAACTVVSPAFAGDTAAPAPLSPADLKAATAAATSATGHTLATQLADSTGGQSVAGSDHTLAVAASAPTQVNLLSADFVRSGTGPVATAAYVATTATVDGQTVTLWSTKTDKGWEAVNAAQGDVEAQMATAAAGAPMFREPQINAWYAIRDGRVIGLNGAAKQAVGEGMSLADYQAMVHTKYGDKLPGSAYAMSSKGGGVTPATGRPQAEQLAGSPLAAAGIGGLALLGTAGLLVRRRSATR